MNRLRKYSSIAKSSPRNNFAKVAFCANYPFDWDCAKFRSYWTPDVNRKFRQIRIIVPDPLNRLQYVR
jgi:hypothetical protein